MLAEAQLQDAVKRVDHILASFVAGGRHSYWGFDSERSMALPRHREIAWPLAREICKQLDIPLPTGPR